MGACMSYCKRRDSLPIVTGTEITVNNGVPLTPIEDTLDQYEWKISSGMNVNYLMDDGYKVKSHAPGDCLWMSKLKQVKD